MSSQVININYSNKDSFDQSKITWVFRMYLSDLIASVLCTNPEFYTYELSFQNLPLYATNNFKQLRVDQELIFPSELQVSPVYDPLYIISRYCTCITMITRDLINLVTKYLSLHVIHRNILFLLFFISDKHSL